MKIGIVGAGNIGALLARKDTKHHIVVANAVTDRGHDRSHLLEMAQAATAEIGSPERIALARPRLL
jgi:prephenate dehydrogenase